MSNDSHIIHDCTTASRYKCARVGKPAEVSIPRCTHGVSLTTPCQGCRLRGGAFVISDRFHTINGYDKREYRDVDGIEKPLPGYFRVTENIQTSKPASKVVRKYARKKLVNEVAYPKPTRSGEKKFLAPYESLWPEVHPRSELEEIRATMRDRKWQALYMCRPSVGANCLFPRDKWGTLGNYAPIAINQAWDFSSGKSGAKNDYTVCCTVALMNNGRYAVLDVFRGKPDFPMMKQLVFAKWVEIYQRYGIMPQVFIEDASAGQQMLQEIAALNMREKTLVQPIPVMPTHNKEVRAEAIASAQNNGQVDLADFACKEEFIRELEEFPLSEHDDCVDAYTWAQAGFVRGEGFFKLPQAHTSEVFSYDAMEHYQGDLGDLENEMQSSDPVMGDATRFALERIRRR